uniref:GEVED domain-containing protein n=1 Tax=Flavobacterium filum TaxID=370974 RepID=UPI00054EF91B
MNTNYKSAKRRLGSSFAFSWLGVFALFLFLNGNNAFAQVANYTFSQTTGTYTPITGGTNNASTTTAAIDDNVYSNLPIGFTFSYNGLNYSSFGINANGWITLGTTTVTSNSTPLSSGTINNIISAFGIDLIARQHFVVNRTSGNATLTVTAGNTNNLAIGSTLIGTGIVTGATVVSKTATTITMSANATSNGTGSHLRAFESTYGIRYETIGSAPNRTLVVQFTGFSRYSTSASNGDLMNFQIRLNETTNIINVIYNMVTPNSTGNIIPQVGLRGGTSADFNNRTSTTDWSATTAGGSNTATITFNNTVTPSVGLTYTWTPPVIAIDMAATAITGIPTSNCANNSVPVSVTITNNGANTIDFSTNNATVTLNVTGASTQTLSATLNSGTLATGASQSVLLSPNANFSVAGTHNLSATVTVTGDGAAGNNTTTGSKVIAATATAPYTMDFPTTSTPTGWNTTGWTIGAAGHSVTSNGIYKNMWSSATTGQFNTIAVGPIGSNDELKFDFRILNYNLTYPGTQVPPTGDWGNFKVQISTDCGGSYADLQTINNTNHTVTDQSWTTKIYNLASYSGQFATFRIVATWVAGDYYLDFDNFSIAPVPVLPPNCATGLVPADTATNVFRNASLSWSAATGSPSSYDVYFGTSSNPGFVANVTSLSYTPAVMAANTTYYWKIVPKNDNGDAVGCLEQSFTTGADLLYCASVPTSNDASGITQVVLGSTSVTIPDVTYQNNTATVVSVNQGAELNTQITFATGFTYDTNIWIDFNDNGSFADSGELVYTGVSLSTNPTTLNATFTMPMTAALGAHRMRIGTADSGQVPPNPCYSGSFGVTLDFTVQVNPMPTDTPDYVNLQFPGSATILAGEFTTVYAQVYEGGLTDVEPGFSGQAAGIEAWIGISPLGADASSNPNTWTTWIPATHNAGAIGNNDEYQANIGSSLVVGTYRYASRFRLNGGPFVYGGFPFNQWNGSDSNSGVLTVNPNPTQCAVIGAPANATTNVTIGTVALSWTAPTSGPAPTGYKVYFGTTSGSLTLMTTTNASTFTYNATAPAYSTTYFWRIVPTSVIGGGDAVGCSEWSFTTQADPFAPYCSGLTFTSAVEPITLVNFAGINNTSSATLNGTPAHQNFISTTGEVTTESTYAITLKGNTDGNFANNFRVFIDWNQDGDFNDAGETFNAGSVTNSTGVDALQAVTNITIPGTALAGVTRMRVKKLFGTTSIDNPCIGGGFGQVEDYSLNVTLCTKLTWYADADGDGYGNENDVVEACSQPVGYVAIGGDCDDTNSAINPGATEICYDGIDQNCNGSTTDGCPVILARLRNDNCGATLTAINQALRGDFFSSSIPNGVALNGYRFRVTNMTTNVVRVVERPNYVLQLSTLDIAQYGTVYNVEVAVLLNTEWMPYGDICSVVTPGIPSTVLAPSSCGATLAQMNNIIRATVVPAAVNYEYEVSLIEGSIPVATT